MSKPTKSILTKYEEYSVFSGTRKTCDHHLVFGRFGAWRDLSEQWGLKIPLIDSEHNMSSKGTTKHIHGNSAAESLSKMLGQVAFEKEYYRKKVVDDDSDPAREEFRKLFGESFL